MACSSAFIPGASIPSSLVKIRTILGILPPQVN
jgi:hypothetical protein